jgi:hypothetical protein
MNNIIEEKMVGVALHEAKRIAFLLNNHQKLINMLKIPEVLKSSLSSDIISVRKILERAKIIENKE